MGKVKKAWYKKWWVWVIAIFVIGGIASGGGESEPKSETASTTPKQETKEAPKQEEKSFKIGDKVKVGDMEYIIKKKSTADQVGPSALPAKASGQFVVLDVVLKNNGNEAVTIDSSFFKLKRGEKTYEADSAGSISANQVENGQIENSFFLQELNPDSSAEGKVVFDISPDVAKSSDLQVQVQTGVFGTETGIINLK